MLSITALTMLGALVWLWLGWGFLPPPAKFAVIAIMLANGAAVATLMLWRSERW